VLIGYTPNCKAYRCWQRSTGKIFNSGNVRFIESGQTEDVYYDKNVLAERLARPSTTDAAAASVPSDQSSPDPPMSTSTLPTLNDPVEFTDPPPSVTVTAETQALPAQQAIPGVAGALPAQQAIPQQAAVPTLPPPLRRSERQRVPRVHLADQDADDDGELDILRGIQDTITESPEDDDGVETTLMTQLTSYLAENPINVEYPDDPRNYREAMAAPDAPAWIEGTREELKALRDLGVYELVPPTSVPRDKTILDLKAVYTRKRNENSEVVRNKVRYCVLGC
jgi:hypothetical protein